MPNRIPLLGTKKLNLGSGRDIRPPTEGWTNLDGFVDHPDVVKHDLTRFPWPFADNQFDLVFASHVLEHLPILFEEGRGTRRDILFHVLEEVHRILEPGGRFHIVVPFGGTDAGMDHPEHFRQWRPEWFRFFGPYNAEAASYHRAHFERRQLQFNRHGIRARHFLPLGPSRLGVTEHLLTRLPRLFGWALRPRHEIEAVLVAQKEPAVAASAGTPAPRPGPPRRRPRVG